MSESTGIEWTDSTWNPVRGCSRVSPGCQNCYAERVAARFSGGHSLDMARQIRREPGPFHGFATQSPPRWTGKVALVEDHLLDPLRWRKPRRIFVNSMSDLFHESLPDEAIMAVFGVMAACPQHTFQVLTKRADRMLRFFSGLQTDDDGPGCDGHAHRMVTLLSEAAGVIRKHEDDHERAFDLLAERVLTLADETTGAPKTPWPLPNVWLGVSAEDQERADERIPPLLQTPAAVRFVSAEPLLGPVDLSRWTRIAWKCSGCRGYFPNPWMKVCPTCGREDYWSGSHPFNGGVGPFPSQVGSGLDWVIVGGESGPGARPCDLAWVRSIKDQCKFAGVACFVKQLGRDPTGLGPFDRMRHNGFKPAGGEWRRSLIDRKGGDPAEWPEDLRVREFPT